MIRALLCIAFARCCSSLIQAGLSCPPPPQSGALALALSFSSPYPGPLVIRFSETSHVLSSLCSDALCRAHVVALFYRWMPTGRVAWRRSKFLEADRDRRANLPDRGTLPSTWYKDVSDKTTEPHHATRSTATTPVVPVHADESLRLLLKRTAFPR